MKNKEDDLSYRIENSVRNYMHMYSPNSTILVGVSGGIDSMTLLFVMNKIAKEYNHKIVALLINHHIRSEEECNKDAELVTSFCTKNNIKYHVIEFDKGQVQKTADERLKGIEEAARFLRYNAFEDFAEKLDSKIFFLAHHQDDQLETLLQRFFQGAFGISLCGMLEERLIYVRPFLSVSRLDIEEYAKINSIEYRYDCTNDDTNYFRNKLRKIIIPLLDKTIEGWRASVLHGREKQLLDAQYLDELAESFVINKEIVKNKNSFWVNINEFEKLNIAIKIRVVYRILAMLKIHRRIPYEFVKRICCGWQGNEYEISVKLENEKLMIENSYFSRNSFEYFGIITENKSYETKFGSLCIEDKNLPAYIEITKKNKLIKRI